MAAMKLPEISTINIEELMSQRGADNLQLSDENWKRILRDEILKRESWEAEARGHRERGLPGYVRVRNSENSSNLEIESLVLEFRKIAQENEDLKISQMAIRKAMEEKKDTDLEEVAIIKEDIKEEQMRISNSLKELQQAQEDFIIREKDLVLQNSVLKKENLELKERIEKYKYENEMLRIHSEKKESSNECERMRMELLSKDMRITQLISQLASL